VRLSFRKSFERDLKRISDPIVLRRVRQAIEQVEAAEDLSRVRRARRLSGSCSFYRIRIGEYQIGLAVEASDVEFVRVLQRRDIYRYFREVGAGRRTCPAGTRHPCRRRNSCRRSRSGCASTPVRREARPAVPHRQPRHAGHAGDLGAARQDPLPRRVDPVAREDGRPDRLRTLRHRPLRVVLGSPPDRHAPAPSGALPSEHSRGVLVRCLGKGDLRWLWRQDAKDVQSTCKSREPASAASTSQARRPMPSSRMPKPSSPPAKPDR